MDLCAHIAAWALQNNVSSRKPTFTKHCSFLVSIGTARVYDAGIFTNAPHRRYIVTDVADDARHAVLGSHNGHIFLLDESNLDSTRCSAEKATVIHYKHQPTNGGKPLLHAAYAAASCIGTGIFLTLHKGQQVAILQPVQTVQSEAWVLVAVACPIFPGSATGYVRADCLIQTPVDYDIDFANAGCVLLFAPNPRYEKHSNTHFTTGDTLVSTPLDSMKVNDYGIMLSRNRNQPQQIQGSNGPRTAIHVIYSTVDSIKVGDIVTQVHHDTQTGKSNSDKSNPFLALALAKSSVVHVKINSSDTDIPLLKKGSYYEHDIRAKKTGVTPSSNFLLNGLTFSTWADMRIYARNHTTVTASYKEQHPADGWSTKESAFSVSGEPHAGMSLLNCCGPNSAVQRAAFLPALPEPVTVPHMYDTTTKMRKLPTIFIHNNRISSDCSGAQAKICGKVSAVTSDANACYLHNYKPDKSALMSYEDVYTPNRSTVSFSFSCTALAKYADPTTEVYGRQVAANLFMVHRGTLLWKEGLWTGDIATFAEPNQGSVMVTRTTHQPANVQYETNVTILAGRLNGRPLQWCNGEYLPTMSHAFNPHVEVAVVYADAPTGPKGALLATETPTYSRIVLEGPFAGSSVHSAHEDHTWLYLTDAAPPSITFRSDGCIGNAALFKLTGNNRWLPLHAAQSTPCSMTDWFKTWPQGLLLTSKTLKAAVTNLKRHDAQLGYALQEAFNNKFATADYEDEIIATFEIDQQKAYAYKVSGLSKALIDAIDKTHPAYSTLILVAPLLDRAPNSYVLNLIHDVLENNDEAGLVGIVDPTESAGSKSIGDTPPPFALSKAMMAKFDTNAPELSQTVVDAAMIIYILAENSSVEPLLWTQLERISIKVIARWSKEQMRKIIENLYTDYDAIVYPLLHNDLKPLFDEFTTLVLQPGAFSDIGLLSTLLRKYFPNTYPPKVAIATIQDTLNLAEREPIDKPIENDTPTQEEADTFDAITARFNSLGYCYSIWQSVINTAFTDNTSPPYEEYRSAVISYCREHNYNIDALWNTVRDKARSHTFAEAAKINNWYAWTHKPSFSDRTLHGSPEAVATEIENGHYVRILEGDARTFCAAYIFKNEDTKRGSETPKEMFYTNRGEEETADTIARKFEIGAPRNIIWGHIINTAYAENDGNPADTYRQAVIQYCKKHEYDINALWNAVRDKSKSPFFEIAFKINNWSGYDGATTTNTIHDAADVTEAMQNGHYVTIFDAMAEQFFIEHIFKAGQKTPKDMFCTKPLFTDREEAGVPAVVPENPAGGDDAVIPAVVPVNPEGGNKGAVAPHGIPSASGSSANDQKANDDGTGGAGGDGGATPNSPGGPDSNNLANINACTAEYFRSGAAGPERQKTLVRRLQQFANVDGTQHKTPQHCAYWDIMKLCANHERNGAWPTKSKFDYPEVTAHLFKLQFNDDKTKAMADRFIHTIKDQIERDGDDQDGLYYAFNGNLCAENGTILNHELNYNPNDINTWDHVNSLF